jgi:hypothetical protein
MARRSHSRRSRTSIAAVIRTDSGQKLKVPAGSALQEFAVRWAYLIRNRNHWNKTEQATMRTALRRQLERFGYTPHDFQQLSNCRLIEVEIPYRAEMKGWEARVMPWEFVLTNLTDGQSGGAPPIVVRRLKVRGQAPLRTSPHKGHLAYIQSAPGALAKFFEFSKERKLVFNSLSNTNWLTKQLEIINPTLSGMRSAVDGFSANLIHVTAIDNHQGAELLGEKDSRFRDGMYLRDEHQKDQEIPVAAGLVASALAGEASQPKLVGLNVCHSAPRIAPLTLAAGASAVVAFQDLIDDTLSELFFADFYRAWSKENEDVLAAFEGTLRNLIRSSGLTLAGTGIVLWSAQSLLDPNQARAASDDGYNAAAKFSELDPTRPLEQLIEVELQHRENINYSLLHNGRSLFEKLYLVNRTGKRLDNLQVKVRLFVGQDSDEQTTRLSVAGPGIDLRPHVTLPLLSRQLRCFRESVLTSLKVTVEWDGHPITDRILRVRILPLNEWCDSDSERQWLPSFVQPIDPSVSQILAAAERHLRTITGDPYAGFDGYQQVEGAADPDLTFVDHQVEAIWDALLHNFSLAYVNPPPTYTIESQRIRTPGEVLQAARGTCLDLTVLLASCLEHIDIYPAIILLKEHAFPAYWRSSEFHKEFWGSGETAMKEAIDFDETHARGQLDDQHHRFLWMTRGSGYSRLTKVVALGHLAPLESVWLTSREPFTSACEAGGENLVDRGEFECLIDIHRARELNVLPLPERD